MTFQREHIDVYSATADGVNHAVLISDAATPLALEIAFQWLWLTKTSKRVLLNVGKQSPDTLENTYILGAFPVLQMFRRLRKYGYFHISSKVITLKLPFFMSSSPWRTISSNSAIDKVSSDFVFCAAIRFSERTAFFIKPSSDDMVWSAPKSSELSCICSTVILLIAYIFAAKIRIFYENANKTVK